MGPLESRGACARVATDLCVDGDVEANPGPSQKRAYFLCLHHIDNGMETQEIRTLLTEPDRVPGSIIVGWSTTNLGHDIRPSR